MGLFNKKKDTEIAFLKSENKRLRERGDMKDEYFMELMSDALRHGSSLAGKHMADRKKYLNGK